MRKKKNWQIISHIVIIPTLIISHFCVELGVSNKKFGEFMLEPRTLRPDSKGRITLGSLSDGVSGFRMTIDTQHRIILEPLVEISAHEKWLFNNPVALGKIKKGIEDAAQGKIKKRDFSKYLDDHDDQ